MSENRPLKIYTELDAKTNVAVSGNLQINTSSSFNTVTIVTSSQGMFDVAGALHELDQAIVDKGLEIKSAYEGARYRVVSFLDSEGKSVINLTNEAPQGIQYFTTGNLEDVKLDVLINTLDDGHFKNDMASVQLYVSGGCLIAEIDAMGAANAEFRMIAVNETVLAMSGVNNGPNGGMIYTLATTSSNGLMSATDKAILNNLSSNPVTYSLATQSSNGLMSSGDKTKLDYLNISSSNIILTKLTASSGYISGDFTVDGVITAQEYHTEYVSASVIYESGSTKFGNDSLDIHQFSGSVYVSGNLQVNGTLSGATQISVTQISSSQYVNLPTASATTNGIVTTGSQTIAGDKTFNNAVNVGGALNTTARNTWTKPQVGSVTALTSSAGTLTVDLSTTNNFSFACAATTTAYTLGAPTNAAAGQSGIIVVTQGGTSASTLAFNSFWKFPTGMDKTMSTTLSSVNAIAYYLPTASYAICSFLKEIA